MADSFNYSDYFEENKPRFIDEWKEFLSFPSISTAADHDKDCMDCAAWLLKHMEQTGLSAEMIETGTKPVVFAERPGKTGSPTVLFYGHYDVQPIDPVEAWETPPFQPEIRNGRMFARGAQDNKGQLLFVLKAIETLIRNDRLEAGIKVIIEGEEESGCIGITGLLPKIRNRLTSDILMVADTSTVSTGAPTIILGLRGLVHLTVTLGGLSHDLHSGVHGGVAPNPVQAIARLVASLHDADGKIAVEGFYDNVRGPDDLEQSLAKLIPFDESIYAEETGVLPMAGEKKYTPVERAGFRPSMDINGISGGYSGPGVKTVIGSSASAKITARLVPDQDPDNCLELITRHIQAHAPDGLTLQISETGTAGPGFRLDPNSQVIQKAKSVLDRISTQETVFLWEGASIPIVAQLAEIASAEPLLVGFGSEQDNIHAPNESFSLDQFQRGFLYAANFLEQVK